MKIIHTSDWHIGKIVNEFSMVKDQEYILNQFLEILDEEKPDALIIAGDLYDRSIPPVEACELLNKTFTEILVKRNIKILAVAGNHDGGERISFGNQIFKENGLYIEGILKKDIEKVTLSDEYGAINFYLVPYADPRIVKNIFDDSSIKTHDDAMRVITDKIKENMNKDERNILITHGYVSYIKCDDYDESLKCNNEIMNDMLNEHTRAGLITSESERPLSIGGTDIVSAEYFEEFNYTALGHLHRMQKVKNDNIRYGGSLLKYSFSEENQKKGITIVELDKDGKTDIKLKYFAPLRDMRTIKGTIEKLTSKEYIGDKNTKDYVFAILEDDGCLIEPLATLRGVYPNIMGLLREANLGNQTSKTAASSDYKNKTELELFSEFYKNILGKELDDVRKDVMTKVIEEALRGDI